MEICPNYLKISQSEDIIKKRGKKWTKLLMKNQRKSTKFSASQKCSWRPWNVVAGLQYNWRAFCKKQT